MDVPPLDSEDEAPWRRVADSLFTVPPHPDRAVTRSAFVEIGGTGDTVEVAATQRFAYGDI
ncbi:hypothetical protein GCM10010464_12470 [Pseudonocardia yunnanensis]